MVLYGAVLFLFDTPWLSPKAWRGQVLRSLGAAQRRGAGRRWASLGVAGRRGGPKRRLFIGYLNGGLKRIALITMVKHG